jgi:tRNA wybutosine-synthesizing protein 2
MPDIGTTARSPPRTPPHKRAPKPKPPNPIESAIRTWFATLPSPLLASLPFTLSTLLASSPKRWVVYPPLVLLPSGSFHSPNWSSLTPHLSTLWPLILAQISTREGKGALTHLAINAGIPLNTPDDGEAENILRSPSGLIFLHGDFGPEIEKGREPSARDFQEAFWVSSKQNGIVQVWAPRYTMFSRGNVTEKARLLGFRDYAQVMTAVDLYAGIGYFVFSYVAIGTRRVLGWELNPWSVEGLRRGAAANGWEVKVVRPGEEWDGVGHERIVVFLEDNRNAEKRVEGVKALGSIRHINCGLLPTSEASWKMALRILNADGWLHLHENVGAKDVVKRGNEIKEVLRTELEREKAGRELKIEHIETVKSFAPGVFHIVYDVYVSTKT